jgi:hypothetical protein
MPSARMRAVKTGASGRDRGERTSRRGRRFRAIDAREEEGIRPGERGERLPQPPARRELCASEGISRVQEQEVHVAAHGQMLVAVVEEEEVRAQPSRGVGALGAALRRHDDDAGKLSREFDRLIAAALRIHERSVSFRDDDDAGRAPPVAAREDRRPPPVEAESSGQPFDERRLPGSAHRYVPDGDRRCGGARGSGGAPSRTDGARASRSAP